MAIAVSLRFDIIDQKGKTSFTKIRVPTGRTIPAYIEFAQGIAQIILNNITGRITRASVCFSLDLSTAGLNPTPGGISKVAVKGNFRWNTNATGFKANMNIPSLLETLVVAGSDDINQVATAVSDFIDDVENGVAVTGGTMVFTNGRGHTITAISSAKERFRRRQPS